jgi:hypothetical protein
MAVFKKTTEYELKAPPAWDDPYVSCEPITPADAVLAQGPTRAVWADVAGNIALVFEGDDTAVVLTIAARTLYKFRVKRINSTSTTATGIFAFR